MKPEWQPISTAPKDGRVILGFWSMEYVETITFRGGGWIWSNDGDTWSRGGPTHWMPLPSPPEPHHEE